MNGELTESIGMIHKTVNHSVNFVDPSTGTHTQSIESSLAQVKKINEKKRCNAYK